MSDIIYYGKVVDGGLKLTNRKGFASELMALEGKEIELKIRKKRKFRSLSQNAWYWGVAIPIIQEALLEADTFSKEQVHDLLKFKFLQEDVNFRDGEFITRIKSTKELTTTEFMHFKFQIQKWAAEFLNCQVPDPNESPEFEFTPERIDVEQEIYLP